MTEITVRAATPEDAPGMARVHVLSWQQTYRGLESDEVLDAPDFVERRERMWNRVLGDSERGFATAVAETGGEIVGIAFAGPAEGEQPPRDWQLYVLYLLQQHQGSGAGQQLIDAVLRGKASVLWVADPNPRAQAFYARNGFIADGHTEPFGSGREIRMVRGSA
jgi:GNAT superfamily N-acetyltransferase